MVSLKGCLWRVMTKWHTADKKQASEFRSCRSGEMFLITYSFLPAFVKEAIHHRTNPSALFSSDEAQQYRR